MYHFEINFWNSLQTERTVFSSLSFCTWQGFRLSQTEHFLQRFLRREPDLKQFLPFTLAPLSGNKLYCIFGFLQWGNTVLSFWSWKESRGTLNPRSCRKSSSLAEWTPREPPAFLMHPASPPSDQKATHQSSCLSQQPLIDCSPHPQRQPIYFQRSGEV